MAKRRKLIFLIGYAVILVTVLILWCLLSVEQRSAKLQTATESASAAMLMSELRNMKEAAMYFRKENLDKLDTIKPEIGLIAPYLDNPKITQKPGEYIFEEYNGEWWIGRNLAISGLNNSEFARYLKGLGGNSIFGSMDKNVPYDGGNIVYRPVM